MRYRPALYSCTRPPIQCLGQSGSEWEGAIPAQSPTMRLMNPQWLWFVFYSWVSNFIPADEFRPRSGRSSSVTLQQPHHENSFLTLSNYRELQLGSTERSCTLKPRFLCRFIPFFPPHFSRGTVVKCKQRHFLTFDRWLFGACFFEVSEASSRNECAEHKQVKRSAILYLKNSKKAPPRRRSSFCFWNHPFYGLASICI